MQEGFSVLDYAFYLRERWKFLAIAITVAGVLSASISVLLPKRYTATAVLLVDAPAGSDPRSATVVSPVYLESLKTFEHFVTSETLFARAAQRFHLGNGASVDSLRRSVLKVEKPRDTRLLEISVTLPDPVKAQAVANFLAQESADLNRSLSRQTDDELVVDAQLQLDGAQARLDKAEHAFAEVEKKHPFDSIYAETSGLIELRTRLQRDAADAKADAAETPPPPGAAARNTVLQKEIESLDQRIAANQAHATEERSITEPVEFDLHAARAARDTTLTRLNELRGTMGIRGERLRVIDPGIVPQRPSSPNIPLNIFAAVFVATVGALIALTFAFVFQQKARPAPVRVAYR